MPSTQDATEGDAWPGLDNLPDLALTRRAHQQRPLEIHVRPRRLHETAAYLLYRLTSSAAEGEVESGAQRAYECARQRQLLYRMESCLLTRHGADCCTPLRGAPSPLAFERVAESRSANRMLWVRPVYTTDNQKSGVALVLWMGSEPRTTLISVWKTSYRPAISARHRLVVSQAGR
jgi:hypothetical protein